MKINYFVKESLRGFNTAKLSTLASVFTISLSLVLLAIFFTLSINSNKVIKSLKEKVELEVFLDDGITQDEISDIKEKIRTIGGVKQMTFITKDEATKIFENEFGKDMLEVLESNPLPPSIKVTLYDEYKTSERIIKIKNQVSTFPKVTDIVFPEKNLQIIEKNSSAFLLINFVVLVIITLTSIFLVSNTIRLVISARSKLVDLLKLLGAKNSFIVTPFLIEGFLQGIMGAVIAIFILLSFYFYLNTQFYQNDLKLDFFGIEYLGYLTLLGLFLGVFGSALSVRRFIKKQNYAI